MKKHGFNDYEYEWWHYTLANEPYPDTYFDFLVNDETCKGNNEEEIEEHKWELVNAPE
jgi:hypothetical protein